jgi:hypothetical protein
MTTVCVTYNTLFLTPPKLLREYGTGLSASKKPDLRLFIINSIRLGKYRSPYSAKPMPVQTSECFIRIFNPRNGPIIGEVSKAGFLTLEMVQ